MNVAKWLFACLLYHYEEEKSSFDKEPFFFKTREWWWSGSFLFPPRKEWLIIFYATKVLECLRPSCPQVVNSLFEAHSLLNNFIDSSSQVLVSLEGASQCTPLRLSFFAKILHVLHSGKLGSWCSWIDSGKFWILKKSLKIPGWSLLSSFSLLRFSHSSCCSRKTTAAAIFWHSDIIPLLLPRFSVSS